MQILERVALQPFNTLNCAVRCDFFAEISCTDQLREAQEFAARRQLPLLILGGGSNIVLTEDFHGLVLKIAMRGVRVTDELSDDGRISVAAAAGENWDDLVQYCLARGWYGLENLSLIPGCVGAAPIQNIGAYGVELAELLLRVRVWDLDAGRSYCLSAEECQLAYRDSIFKHALRDRVVITEVEIGLYCGDNTPAVNIGYGALQEYFTGHSEASPPTPEQVRAAVIAIRRAKLPDPADLPNVGSFFKNPVIAAAEFARLKRAYPDVPSYPQQDGSHKVPAAWLIDQCGWKGRHCGEVAVHDQQALVLVNRAAAQSGAAVLALARTIQADVANTYGIELEIEPRVY